MAQYIEFDHVTKSFSGQTVLQDVTFSVKKGEIHAIIGENGAGKSTLLNILHGVFPASGGEIRIEGRPLHFRGTAEAIAAGIAKVHQEIVSIPDMTVAENLFVGKEPGKFGFLNKKQMNENARRILGRLNMPIDPEEKMRDLSTGQKQMISIAKALELNPKIISFDEPTASLSDAEVSVLFSVIRELKEKGITILYISHKMSEIFELCERATVLRDGRYITTLELDKATRDDMIHAMVGRDVAMFAQRTLPNQTRDEVVLEVRGLRGKAFHDISFQLHAGEILGFFGLIGAGRTEVMRAIFGADPILEGEVLLCGTPVRCKEPAQAIRRQIAMISENRKEEGVIPNLDNMDNIALPSLDRFRKGLFVQNGLKYDNALRVGKQVNLHPNDPNFMTASLSGGNAQKVMLARWMSTDARVMIFDEPTKGIDIGAKAEIYYLMEKMAEAGMAIIMVSSELTEIIGMSDRILVMRDGALSGELTRAEFSEDAIMHDAVGG